MKFIQLTLENWNKWNYLISLKQDQVESILFQMAFVVRKILHFWAHCVVCSVKKMVHFLNMISK